MTILTYASPLATVAREAQQPLKNAKREQLKELSKAAAELVQTGEFETINQALVECFYKKDEHQEFKTFNQWKKEGYFVKAGSQAFLVWGKPKANQEQEKQEGQTEQEQDDSKFFPMAYLFSNAQVIAATPKAQEAEGIYSGIYTIDWRLKRVANGLTITSAQEVEDFVRPLFEDVMETREKFMVVYLTSSNEILGTYIAGLGGITATVADIQLILRHALLYGASGLIIAHNHPSGALKPSNADISLTKKIAESAKLMDLTLLDHLIVTYKGCYSFTNEGMM